MQTETQARQSTARQGTQKDVYQIITGRVIELLERGVVPWRTPWTKGGVPKNLISRRGYRGINAMLLGSLGYERNFFITSKQLKEIDGAIRAEEKPHMVAYWNFGDRDASGTAKEKEADGGRKSPNLRYYTVYNVWQCAGILGELVPPVDPTPPFPGAACEGIVEKMLQKPEIRHKEPEPFYDCLEDYVNMPKQKSFASEDAYYSALFHQLAHSTGHHTRLDRAGIGQMSEYGGNEFSTEELVAEIATGYMCSLAGISDPFKATDEYVKGWIARFKADRHILINASTQAQRAVDFMLNIVGDDREQGED